MVEKRLHGQLQPKIIISSENSNDIIDSQIIDGLNIYECNFTAILVKIITNPNAEISIVNLKTKNEFIKLNANSQGEAIFRINSQKQRDRLNFEILISSENSSGFRYKFVILIDTKKPIFRANRNEERAVEILKNHNYKSNSQNGTNFLIDLMDLTDVKFDIERILYTNEHYPVLKFKVSDYDEFKLSIIGFNDHLFKEPDFIDGEILFEKDYFVFICKSKFFLEGKYMFVVRYFDSDGTKEPKEEHFVLWIKFSNDDILKANLEFNEIYGDGASSKCKVILFSINEQNGFDEIKRVMSDELGKFSIKLIEKELNLFKTRKFLLRSLDKHGNFSKPFVIN